MGMIARLKQWVRTSRNGAQISEAKLDPGGGALLLSESFSAPGEDSQPLDTDYLAIMRVQGTGRAVVVGTLDPKNADQSGPGERRLYSRDSGGNVVSSIWLKADGSIALESTGDITINGVTISATGQVTVPSSLKVGGKELNNHDHPILSGSSSPGPTGPNNP